MTASDAPEGTSYLKVTDREAATTIQQFVNLPADFDPSKFIEVKYWAKFSFQDAAIDAATTGEDRHFDLLGKITVGHEPNSDGNSQK